MFTPLHGCCYHAAAHCISPPGQDSTVCGGIASLEEKTWPHLELVEMGMTGPHEVLHWPVHRDKVLGAAWGRDRATHTYEAQTHTAKAVDQEAEIPGQEPKDLST